MGRYFGWYICIKIQCLNVLLCFCYSAFTHQRLFYISKDIKFAFPNFLYKVFLLKYLFRQCSYNQFYIKHFQERCESKCFKLALCDSYSLDVITFYILILCRVNESACQVDLNALYVRDSDILVCYLDIVFDKEMYAYVSKRLKLLSIIKSLLGRIIMSMLNDYDNYVC